MKSSAVYPNDDFSLTIVKASGDCGRFDVQPYLKDEAFRPLCDIQNFRKVRNGGYYIEWECGADLSADTIEAHLSNLV